MRDRTSFVRKHMKEDIRRAVERNMHLKHIKENIFTSKDGKLVHVCFGNDDLYIIDRDTGVLEFPAFYANVGVIDVQRNSLHCGRCGTYWEDKKLAMVYHLKEFKYS